MISVHNLLTSAFLLCAQRGARVRFRSIGIIPINDSEPPVNSSYILAVRPAGSLWGISVPLLMLLLHSALLRAGDENVQSTLAMYQKLVFSQESARLSERPFITTQAQYAGSSLLAILRVGYSEQVIPADPVSGLTKDQRIKLRCYNGNMIGPTLRVRPGIRLRIVIKNELPAAEPDGDCEPHPPSPTTPHGFNCTNLHTHGLHVSPKDQADNVFVEIPPGSPAYTYEYYIPRDHVAGTFWYHPHKHGSVALQVTTGLAGAVIVEGGLDEIPEIREAAETAAFVSHFSRRQ